MHRTPKVTTVKKEETGLAGLAISGKNIFRDKKDPFSTSANEFTFSPKAYHAKADEGPVTFKKSAPKNPFERNLVQGKNPHESITKNEMFDLLGIKNPEAEHVADLSIHSMVMGASTVPRNKKEVTENLISNLETEIEKLKYKRDNYIADKERKRKEELEKSRREQEQRQQDEETNIVLHKDEARIQQLMHPISSLEKPTLDNVEALMRAHRDKMQDVERQYMMKKKSAILGPEDYLDPSKIIGPQMLRVPETLKVGKENQSLYERPKSSKAYAEKEYDKNSKIAQVLRMERKKEDQKNYKQRFADYIYDKRDMLEQQEQEKLEREEKKKQKQQQVASLQKKYFDVYQPTSPNPKRSKSPNKWDIANIVENDQPKRSRSPARDHPHIAKAESKVFTSRSDRERQGSGGRSFSPNRSYSKERLKTSPGKRSMKQKDANREVEITEHEVKLLHFVFTMMKKDGAENVDKEDIYEYLRKSPEVIELYDIDAVNLRKDLYAFPSKDRDSFFFEEFLSFLETSRHAAANASLDQIPEMNLSGFKKSQSKFKKSGVRFSPDRRSARPKAENVCMLAKETMDTIEEIFLDVDKHQDDIVKRAVLVKRLREDVRIARVLHKPAVHVVEIDKYLSLERLLRQIEEEETSAIGEQKRAKEYISLKQFLKYFTNYETPDDLAEKMQEFQKTNQSFRKSPTRSTRGFEEDDQDVIELANKHMDFFKRIFESMPKKQNAYVETMQFIDRIRGEDQYINSRRDPARRKANNFPLPPENLEEVVNRIENEAEKYISWDDFVQFFTRRGRPRRLLTTTHNVEQDLIQSGLASDPKDKALQTGAKVVQNIQRDGYDSDPEFHTYNRGINYEFKLNRSVQAAGVQAGIQEELRSSRERSPQKSIREEASVRARSVGNERGRSQSPENMKNASFNDRANYREEGEPQWIERRGRRFEEEEPRLDDSKFGAVHKDPIGLKYTVPDPFEFDTREKVRAKSIRERKVEEMVREKLEEEERILNHRFRANSVPGIVKTPLFEKIIRDQEQRRVQVKKNSVAITKMREAPFDFYLRDKDKPPKPDGHLPSDFNYKFKAKPIPAICQLTDVWKNMKEREDIERKEKVARLAQQNLLLASLPPRMAKHEKEKKEQELRNQINENNMEKQRDKKTFVANDVPNFGRLHRQFQELLDRKRSNKRPTEPRPFNFQESKKGVTREYFDVENMYKKAAKDDNKRDPFESVKKLKAIKPKIQPHTTKKMIALNDLRKKEREERQRKVEQIEKEDEARKEKYHKMKPVVQGSSAIIDNKNAKEQRAKELREQGKKDFINKQKQFEEMKRQIDHKVSQRPLLVEQVSLQNQKLQVQAMQDLSKMKKIMKEAGVRDPDAYFNQDEKDKIADAEFLEKQGFKEFNKKK